MRIYSFGPDTEPAEVVEKVILHMDEPGLCLPHAVRLNAEGQVPGLGQAVVALLQLGLQHLAVFAPDGIKCVLLVRDPDALFKAFRIGRHVQEGQFKMNRAVEEVQETAPFLKNGRLVLVLRQLIVDVLIMDRLGVIVIRNPADTVREHPLERDRLPGRAWHPVVLPRPLDDLLFCLCLPLQDRIVVIRLVRPDLRADEFAFDKVPCNDFKGLSVPLIHGEEDQRQHKDHHAHDGQAGISG